METSEEQLRKEHQALNIEYEKYIKELEIKWKRENKPPQFKDVYEVLRPDERKEIDSHIASWAAYVTPFAEAWWKERGWGVIWPDDDSKPMQTYKL